MDFEWDPAKDLSNQNKHQGIDFASASRIFSDPFLVIRKDRTKDGVQRWHGIGAVEHALLLVVHIYLEEETNGKEIIRIISARLADTRERRVYLEQASG